MNTTTTRRALDFVAAPTIAALAPDWIARLRGRRLSPRTIETYGKTLRAFAAYLGDDPTIAEITTPAIERWMDARLDLSVSSIIKTLGVLRSFSTWCMRAGHRADDPTADLDWPHKRPPLPNPLTIAELRALEAALAAPLPRLSHRLRQTRLRQRRAVLLCLYAGCRRGEVARLNWSDVDLDAQTLTIRHTKWDGSRVVPLHPRLLADLEATPPPSRVGAVIAKQDGSAFDDEHIARAFANWLQAIPALNGVHPHRLRHTFGSKLLEAGVDIRVIAELMGHTDTKTTMRYTLVVSGQRAAAVARLPMDFRGGSAPTPRMAGVCAWCGNPIVNGPGGKKRMFCNVRCKWAMHDARRGRKRRKPGQTAAPAQPLICAWCQAPLPPNDPRGKPRTFCVGSHCRQAAYRARKQQRAANDA